MQNPTKPLIRLFLVLLWYSLWTVTSHAQEINRLPVLEHANRFRLGVDALTSQNKTVGFIETKTTLSGIVKDGRVVIRANKGAYVLSGQYKNGRPIGQWTLRSSNGVVLVSQTYEQGKLDGISISRDATGRKIREQSFKHGYAEGKFVLYDSRGKVTKNMLYKKGKVVKGDFIWKGKVIKLQDERYRRLRDNLFLLNTPKKLCHLSDTQVLTCKTPAQVEHDLSTFLPPEIVSEILDILEGAYGELGLNRDNKILTQCSGTFVATSLQSSSDVAQSVSKHRASLTAGEIDSIMATCRAANLAAIAGHMSGAPDSETQHRTMVNQTKAQGDAMVGQCHTSTSQQHVGIIPAVAAALGIGIPEATAVVVAAASTAAGAAGYVLNEWFDDGWSDWEETAPNTEMRYKEDDPSMKQYKNSEEGTTTTVSSTPDGGRMEYTEHDDGSTTVKKFDKDGKLVSTETFNEDGMPLGDADAPPQGEPASPPSSQPSSPPGGGAGQPDPDAVTCEDKAARWAAFKQRCDQSDWKSYECEQYIRVSNHCPDAALINPGPDGDLTCQPKNPPRDSREEACERRKMVELRTPDSLSNCQFVDKNLLPEIFPSDICRDPRAYCVLDAMVPDFAGQGRGVVSPFPNRPN